MSRRPAQHLRELPMIVYLDPRDYTDEASFNEACSFWRSMGYELWLYDDWARTRTGRDNA